MAPLAITVFFVVLSRHITAALRVLRTPIGCSALRAMVDMHCRPAYGTKPFFAPDVLGRGCHKLMQAMLASISLFSPLGKTVSIDRLTAASRASHDLVALPVQVSEVI